MFIVSIGSLKVNQKNHDFELHFMDIILLNKENCWTLERLLRKLYVNYNNLGLQIISKIRFI